MITLSGRLICANAIEADLVASLLPDHIRLTRDEPGCLSFEVRQGDIIGLAPPLCLSRDEADQIVAATRDAVAEILG